MPGFLEAVQQNWSALVSTCPVERIFVKLQRGLAKACKVGVSEKLGTSSYNWRWLRNFFTGLKLLETIGHYPLVKICYAGNSNWIASGTHGGLNALRSSISGRGVPTHPFFINSPDTAREKKKNLYSQVSTFKWLIISQEEKLKAAFEFNDELLGTATDRDFNLPLIFH